MLVNMNGIESDSVVEMPRRTTSPRVDPKSRETMTTLWRDGLLSFVAPPLRVPLREPADVTAIGRGAPAHGEARERESREDAA